MLPGLQPDPETHPDQYRDPEPDGSPEVAGDHRRGRRGRGVRFVFTASAPKSRCLKCCRASCRSKTRKSRRNSSACFKKQRHSGRNRRARPRTSRTGTASASRPRLPTARTEADRGRNASGRDRPQAQHREHRPGGHESGTRSRIHQSGRLTSDRRAGRLRHRRHRRGNAATGARGDR